jgi:hypothetical protein
MKTVSLLVCIGVCLAGCAPSLHNPTIMPQEPRRHHYEFTHRALPALLFTQKDKTLGLLENDEHSFLKDLWIEVGETVQGDGHSVLEYIDLEFSKEKINNIKIYVARLPKPVGLTEAYFVAIVEKENSIKYFTLERTVVEMCAGRNDATVLGEWTSDGKHLNYGCGPKPLKEDFIRAVTEKP